MHRPRLSRDVMVTELVTLRPEIHVCDGLTQLLRAKITGAPVVDAQHNYLGVFSERCCMNALRLAAGLAAENEKFEPIPLRARDFMVTKLVTLSPSMDVVEAIGQLLKHRISGAPVLDESGRLLGVISERDSMRVLVDAAYDQLPTSRAEPFLNTDFGRIISEDTSLVEVVEIFLRDSYRRLLVVRNDKLVGLISRRDALIAGQNLLSLLRRGSEPAPKPSPASEDRDLSPEGSQTLAPRMIQSMEILQLPLLALQERIEQELNVSSMLPTTVAAFMDTEARTITEETDLLSIAQIFLTTNYRRLPVIRGGKVLGQVSRRDILKATYELMAVAPKREVALLYLSSLIDRQDAPISQ
jgi:CBS domain-containing protein